MNTFIQPFMSVFNWTIRRMKMYSRIQLSICKQFMLVVTKCELRTKDRSCDKIILGFCHILEFEINQM